MDTCANTPITCTTCGRVVFFAADGSAWTTEHLEDGAHIVVPIEDVYYL